MLQVGFGGYLGQLAFELDQALGSGGGSQLLFYGNEGIGERHEGRLQLLDKPGLRWVDAAAGWWGGHGDRRTSTGPRQTRFAAGAAPGETRGGATFGALCSADHHPVGRGVRVRGGGFRRYRCVPVRD